MPVFHFKRFSVDDHGCGMKICTDSVLLGAWADCADTTSIADLGAGSGLLSLMLAQRCPGATVTAIEIDRDACQAARANFIASPWAGRLSVVCADVNTLDMVHADLIVCNPPYFSSALHSPDAKRALARHADTLGPLSALEIASRRLAPGGSIAIVTPAEAEPELTYRAMKLRLAPMRLCRVSTVIGKRPARLLSQWSRTDCATERTTLAIRTPDGDYTDGYRALTHDFYLNF